MAQALPIGIQQLIALKEVKLRQQHKFVGNKYEVVTMDDQFIAKAKEEGGLGAFFGGSSRSFHMDLTDQEERPIINLRRPYTFGGDKMEVSMGGHVVCIVRQQMTFFKCILHINDASDRPVLRIKGDFSSWDYELQTSDKKPIGHISKKFGGLMKELFTDYDTYLISFPQDLDVRFKAAVIGSCVLIDYLQHEK